MAQPTLLQTQDTLTQGAPLGTSHILVAARHFKAGLSEVGLLLSRLSALQINSPLKIRLNGSVLMWYLLGFSSHPTNQLWEGEMSQ